MEQRENQFLETDAKRATNRWFCGIFMIFRLGVRTEEAAENALDFDTRGVHANRFQSRV